MPCNVIVYETNEGQSIVSIVDPLSMLGVVENPKLDPIVPGGADSAAVGD